MLQLLIGKKGTGKTKVLIDNVNEAVKRVDGNVVFISNNTEQSMYDVASKVSMTNTSEFGVSTWEGFYGFICGIVSGNFDITNIFVDGTLKITNQSMEGFEDFLSKIDDLGKKFDVDFEMSLSIDVNDAPSYIKKYVK